AAARRSASCPTGDAKQRSRSALSRWPRWSPTCGSGGGDADHSAERDAAGPRRRVAAPAGALLLRRTDGAVRRAAARRARDRCARRGDGSAHLGVGDVAAAGSRVRGRDGAHPLALRQRAATGFEPAFFSVTQRLITPSITTVPSGSTPRTRTGRAGSWE